MSRTDNDNKPHFLQILLEQSHATHTVNQRYLSHIESRKGHEVIIKREYTLQAQLKTTKKQKIELIDQVDTRSVDDIIEAWRYDGEPLRKEKIAIYEVIDRKLEGFDDLIRLSAQYGVLRNTYSSLLLDEEESRMAVERVIYNIKTI